MGELLSLPVVSSTLAVHEGAVAVIYHVNLKLIRFCVQQSPKPECRHLTVGNQDRLRTLLMNWLPHCWADRVRPWDGIGVQESPRWTSVVFCNSCLFFPPPHPSTFVVFQHSQPPTSLPISLSSAHSFPIYAHVPSNDLGFPTSYHDSFILPSQLCKPHFSGIF